MSSPKHTHKQTIISWVRLAAVVSTYMLMWSLMRSHTIRLLLSLAKYMAVFLCLERMLQSAPYSSRRRTTSVFPLLHAWRKGQQRFTNSTYVPHTEPINVSLDKRHYGIINVLFPPSLLVSPLFFFFTPPYTFQMVRWLWIMLNYCPALDSTKTAGILNCYYSLKYYYNPV